MKPDATLAMEDLLKFGEKTLREIGAEALSFYGKGDTSFRFDENLVTEAEIHLVESFRNRLDATFPEHRLFLDDSLQEGYSHDSRRYLWIFDALDGVDNFQTGIPIWTMSLAMLENFWPVFGMVYMPATGDFFRAAAGGQALHGDKRIGVSESEVDDESLLLTFSRFHQHYQSRFPGKIRNLGCTAAHICYVAMGRADAAIVNNESYKDLAAARIIVESAGGGIFPLDGGSFHLNDYLDGHKIHSPLLVTASGKREAVLDYVQKIG